MAGHALDLGVVEAIGRELVIQAHPFEHGGAAKDQIRFVGGPRDAAGMARTRRNKARSFKRMPERPVKRDDMKFSENKSRQRKYGVIIQEDDGGQARRPFTAP